MGFATCSTSFCFSVNSSVSASGFFKPVQSLVNDTHQLVLLALVDFVGDSFLLVIQSVLQVVEVALETVLGSDSLLNLFVLLSELLSFLDHALDVLGREASLVGSDGNLLNLVGSLINSRHLQDAIGIDFK